MSGISMTRTVFAEWPSTQRLVAPFPSMTNVSFTAIFQPFGVEPIRGYEMRYFDPDRNRIVGGGPIGYKKKAFAWKKLYHVISHTNLEKAAAFTSPRKNVRAVLERTENLVLDSDDELILSHIESTDVLAHFRGDEPVVEIVIEVAAWADDLIRRHEESIGCPLEVVLFSDHGNTKAKVKNISGVHHRLRSGGLQVVDYLRDPGDVVAPTYGVVSFGVLYTDPEHTEQAARIIAGHPAVELAAWIAAPREMRVLADGAAARVEWRDGPEGRRFRYVPTDGDPLRLATVTAGLSSDGCLGDEGFASEDAWFDESILAYYPDALRRLVDSLTGTFVSNPATVIFSLDPDTAWGRKPAQAAAQLMGGDLEGSHGALDGISSMGFFLTTDPTVGAGRTAVAASEALLPWAPRTPTPTKQ